MHNTQLSHSMLGGSLAIIIGYNNTDIKFVDLQLGNGRKINLSFV